MLGHLFRLAGAPWRMRRPAVLQKLLLKRGVQAAADLGLGHYDAGAHGSYADALGGKLQCGASG